MADRTDPLRRSPLFFAALLALAVLELAWLGWFLFEPLPNVPPAPNGARIPRWLFLTNALPGVVPGVRYDQSYLGMALKELSHVENLPQRVPIVLAGTLIGGAAVALGQLVLRAFGLRQSLESRERIPLAFGLGTTGLGLATLLVGRLGGLSPWPVRMALGLLIVAESALCFRGRKSFESSDDRTVDRAQRGPSKPRSESLILTVGFALVASPFLVAMALGAMLPTVEFDSIEYHLQGPKEYFQAGRISFLPHNVYTSMPFGVEMLHLLGMEVLDDWWWGALVGQLLIAAHAPATAAMIALLARRWGSPRAAWVAAVVYLTTPWIFRIAVLPYVEGPLCYFHAALLWLAVRAWDEADPRIRTRLWGVAGLLAGGAMACKYPALISAALPFGILAALAALRRRSASLVLAFAVGWGVVMTPWLAKNVLDTGNPVYPLAYRVFGGRYWDPELEAKWSRVHGPKPVELDALVASIIEVAGQSDWQSSLYVALAPLAFLRPGTRGKAAVLWGFVAYLFGTWWLLTHRLDRFWLPLLPPLAVLAGLGADWVRSRAWSGILVLLLLLSVEGNLAYDSTALVALNDWSSDLLMLRTKIPRDLNASLFRLESRLPAGAKVLLVGQAAVFHMRCPIIYNTVFNHETIETLTRGKSPGEVRDALAARGVTHIYVDWFEIDRYRSPGNYGFTPYVTPELFARLVAAGILDPPEAIGSRRDLYRVH